MNFSFGPDVFEIFQVVHVVVRVLMMVALVGLIVWAVRKRGPTGPERIDEDEVEEVWQLVDRMEARIEVLERALADHNETRRVRRTRDQQDISSADAGHDAGRNQ